MPDTGASSVPGLVGEFVWEYGWVDGVPPTLS